MDKTLFDNLDEWLTTSEAARYLKISKGSLLNMVWSRKVKCYKLGRRNRYLKFELNKLIVVPTPLKRSNQNGI